jgi:hypothetical protein
MVTGSGAFPCRHRASREIAAGAALPPLKEATPYRSRQSIKLKLRGKDRNFAGTRTFRAQGGEHPEAVEAISSATQLPREDTKRSKEPRGFFVRFERRERELDRHHDGCHMSFAEPGSARG